ncbi:MAG: hypothetical protein ACKO5C_01095 [Ferruginibacter sp.]
MRLFFFLVLMASLCLSSCSLFRRPKYGCPVSGSSLGAERLSDQRRDVQKAIRKSKYRGGNKFGY